MSDIESIQELRDRLLESDNEELVAQRDLLLDGKSYPAADVVREYRIEQSAELTLDNPVSVSTGITASELARQVNDRTLPAIVIGARTPGLDNAFELLIRVSDPKDSATDVDAKAPGFVALAGFFDGGDDVPEEHAGHHVDDRGLAISDAPFGHFVLDASTAVTQLADRLPEAEATIHFSLVAGETQVGSSRTLVLADLSVRLISI